MCIGATRTERLTNTLRSLGKNPVVFDPKVDLKMAARRLLWGRFSNGGQVRIALRSVRAVA